MTDLSSTVLRGTDQVTDAYKGLANLRAVNRERKTRAMAGIGESLASLGKTLRDYGSWKDAKAAEDETRQVEDAYALGMQTGEPEKALVTLGATKVRHAASATLRSKRINEVMSLAHQRNVEKSDEALTNYRNQQTEDLKRAAADEAQSRIDAKNVVLPEDASEAEIQLAQDVYSGRVKKAQADPIFKMYADRRKSVAAAKKEFDKTAAASAEDTATTAAWAAYNDDSPILDRATNAYRPPTQRERLAKAMSVPGVPDRVQATISGLVKATEGLDLRQKAQAALETYRRDAFALDQQEFEWKKSAANAGQDVRIWLAQNAQAVEAAKSLLVGADKQVRGEELQRVYIGLDAALTDEEKQARIKEVEAKTAKAKEIIAEFEPLLRSVASQGGKPAPTGPGLGAGQAPVQPHQMSDEELDKAIKAAEGGGK